MTDFENRRLGLLMGSYCADALALGVHWIYDTEKLSKKFGYVDGYHAPGRDSYHPRKQAGEQSHVGDQGLCLAAFLRRSGAWNPEQFMVAWMSIWPGYSDYFDHATKSTLQNVEAGKALTEAGSDSSELAGPARIAPLVAQLADQTEDVLIKAAVEQTLLTHASAEAEEAAVFLAMASHRLLHGADLKETIRTTAPAWAYAKAEAVLNKDTIQAIDALGQSCSISAALPAVIYLVLKQGNNLPKALSENAMAGGDNCARGLALGMLLGAAHGIDALPTSWIDQLVSASDLRALVTE